MMRQMEARNAEDLRRVSEEEKEARRRLQEVHARALARGQASLLRAEETVTDLERVSAFMSSRRRVCVQHGGKLQGFRGI